MGRYACIAAALIFGASSREALAGEATAGWCRSEARAAERMVQRGELALAWDRAEAAGRVCGAKGLALPAPMGNLEATARDEALALTIQEEAAARWAVATAALGVPDPAAEAASRWIEVLYVQGRYAEALVRAEREMALYATPPGEETLRTAVAIENVAMLHHALGRYDEAVAGMVRAVELQERLAGAESDGLVQALNNLAVIRATLGDYAAAKVDLERVVALWMVNHGRRSQDVAMALNNVATVTETMGAFGEALPLHEEALSIREEVLGPDHPDVAGSLMNLGALLVRMGRPAEAAAMARRAEGIVQRSLGPEHPARSQALLVEMTALHGLGRYGEALERGEIARGLLEASGPGGTVNLIMVLGNLATIHQEAGHPDVALAPAKRAAELAESSMGGRHLVTITARKQLANALKQVNRLDEALELYDEVRAIAMEVLGPTHPDSLSVRNDRGTALMTRGRYDEALAEFLAVSQAYSAARGEADPMSLSALSNLAVAYNAMGHYSEAWPLETRVLEGRRARLGPAHPDTLASLNNLAMLYLAAGQIPQALKFAELAAEGRREVLGPRSALTAESDANLCWALTLAGRYDEALPVCEDALSVREEVLGPDHPDVAESLMTLGVLHDLLGSREEAIRSLSQALALKAGASGPDHPLTLAARRNLALVTGHVRPSPTVTAELEAVREATARLVGPDHVDVGRIDLDLAELHDSGGDNAKSLVAARRAQVILEAGLGNDHALAGRAEHRIARSLRKLGEVAEAAPHADRALLVGLASDDAMVRASCLRGAAEQAEAQGRHGEAVLWGKLALQTIEDLRRGIERVDPGLTEEFLTHNRSLHEMLAQSLVRLGRIPEAEFVLARLKADERSRYQRGDADAAVKLPLTASEARWVSALSQQRQSVANDAPEFRALGQAAARGRLPEAQAARLTILGARREVARRAIEELLAALRSQAPAQARVQAPVSQVAVAAGQARITVAVLADRLLLLSHSAKGERSVEVGVSAGEVHSAVADLREALQDPTLDPRGPGKQLYDWIVAPFEADLRRERVNSVEWWLDGSLRYVPMGALYDGERFVAERWASRVATQGAEAPARRGPATVRALGVSRGGAVGARRFSPLENVPEELDAIVYDGSPGDEGAVAGAMSLDEVVTAKELGAQLSAGDPWFHVASHFVFKPGGDETDSFLLLGDQTTLSVAELRRGPYDFGRVELLTLSACETGLADPQADGSEVEGLVEVAREKGAGAVLAALWSVSDRSTAVWMAAFYGHLAEETPRDQAQRVTQLAMLGGAVGPGLVGPPVHPEGLEGWRHPYYWAPFVLYE